MKVNPAMAVNKAKGQGMETAVVFYRRAPQLATGARGIAISNRQQGTSTASSRAGGTGRKEPQISPESSHRRKISRHSKPRSQQHLWYYPVPMYTSSIDARSWTPQSLFRELEAYHDRPMDIAGRERLSPGVHHNTLARVCSKTDPLWGKSGRKDIQGGAGAV